MRLVALLEIIEAGDAGQPFAGIGELQLLAELVLVDIDEDIADLLLGGVDVDIVLGVSFRYAVIDFSVSASVTSYVAVPEAPQ